MKRRMYFIFVISLILDILTKFLAVKYITNIHKTKSDIKTTTIVNYLASIDNFQVDYCLNDSLRTIISPIFTSSGLT